MAQQWLDQAERQQAAAGQHASTGQQMAASAAGHTAATGSAGHSGAVASVASKWIRMYFLPGCQEGRVPLELALSRRADTLTVLHVMAECLRSAQRTKTAGWEEQFQFPVHELLAIPGLAQLVNLPVQEGPLRGKTPLIMLANTPFCAESPAKWGAECFANWLVQHGANPDEPPGVALKYALGCANVFMVGCLLSAGASVAEAESRFEEAAAASSKHATWKLWDFVLAASSAESMSVIKIAKMLEQQGFSTPGNFLERRDARPTRADFQRAWAPPSEAWRRTPRSFTVPPRPRAAAGTPADGQATGPRTPSADGQTSATSQPAEEPTGAVTPPPSPLAPAGAMPQAAGHMATPAAPSNLSTAAAGQSGWWRPPATWMPTWRHGRGAWRIAPLDDEDSDAQWVYDDTTNVYVWVAPRR